MHLKNILPPLLAILVITGCSGTRADKALDRLEAAETKALVAINVVPLSPKDLAKIQKKWLMLKAQPDPKIRVMLGLGDAQVAAGTIERRFADVQRCEGDLADCEKVLETLTSMRQRIDAAPKGSIPGGLADSDFAIEGAGKHVAEARTKLERAKRNVQHLDELTKVIQAVSAEWAE